MLQQPTSHENLNCIVCLVSLKKKSPDEELKQKFDHSWLFGEKYKTFSVKGFS